MCAFDKYGPKTDYHVDDANLAPFIPPRYLQWRINPNLIPCAPKPITGFDFLIDYWHKYYDLFPD